MKQRTTVSITITTADKDFIELARKIHVDENVKHVDIYREGLEVYKKKLLDKK